MLSNGFGVQATSVLGSLLETQLEKNLEEMSSQLKKDEEMIAAEENELKEVNNKLGALRQAVKQAENL